MKVISSFNYKVRGNRITKKEDDCTPMNIDDPVFIKQGLDYLNKVKQDLKKGIIRGKVVGVTYEQRD